VKQARYLVIIIKKGEILKILKGYKTELNPNNKQKTLFIQYCGTARFVYNWALNDRIERYKLGKTTSCYEQITRFNALKDEQFPWIRKTAYIVTEIAFRNLDVAYKNFFRSIKEKKKVAFPKFKSKKNGLGSFSFRINIKVKDNKIKLPLIGWIRLKQKNYLPKENIHLATISEHAGKWFVSILVEEELKENKANELSLGIDFGIKSLAVLSNGKVFENQKPLKSNEKKLKRLQRELARRQKGGKNREKSRKKLARQYERITNIRKNILNKVSSYAVYKVNPKEIIIEDLNIAGMTKNHSLANAIIDVGFGELRRQIEYKSNWNGTKIILTDKWYPSSKTCSKCGNIKTDLKLNDRIYKCDNCGTEIDRDYNASLNLKNYNN
jgi:putative transposase